MAGVKNAGKPVLARPGKICYNFAMKISEKTTHHLVALILVAAGVFFRVMPHPDNFTPTSSIALFAGMSLPAGLALTVPLVLMVLSDMLIGFHSLTGLVWVSFLLIAFFGMKIRARAGWGTVAMSSLAGSVFFFVVSNLGVFFVDKLYPMTWEGLEQCFFMALPFFRSSLIADAVFTFVLFSAYFAAACQGSAREIPQS